MIAVPARPAPDPSGAPVRTPLAAAIYKLLVRRLRSKTPTLTYAELVDDLAPRHATHRRSPAFHAALTEVILACRARELPALPALVHRAGRGRPAPGYFKVAHPRARSESAQIEQWEGEVLAVLASAERYPAAI